MLKQYRIGNTMKQFEKENMWRLSQFFVFPRRGYYTYAGRNHDVCEFQLQFLNGNVEGRGVDDVGRALPGEVLGKVKLGQKQSVSKTIEDY